MSHNRRRLPKCAVCGCEIKEIYDQFRLKFSLPGKPEIAWCGQHKDDANEMIPLMAAAEPDELIVLLAAIEARGPERVIRRKGAGG